MRLAYAHTVQRQRPAKREGHSAQNHSHFRFLQSHWLPRYSWWAPSPVRSTPALAICKSGKSQNCPDQENYWFGIVMTPVGWVYFDQMTRNSCLRVPVFFWCDGMLSWILLTRLFWPIVLSPMGHVAFLWLLCTGVPNLRPQGCSNTLWWMAAAGLEQWDATDVPWNGEHSRRREVGAWQVTVLFNHINEGLIWRARKLIIMKIKVGTSSPNLPSTIHERAHHRSSSKKAFRVQVGPMIRQSVLSRVVGGMNPPGQSRYRIAIPQTMCLNTPSLAMQSRNKEQQPKSKTRAWMRERCKWSQGPHKVIKNGVWVRKKFKSFLDTGASKEIIGGMVHSVRGGPGHKSVGLQVIKAFGVVSGADHRKGSVG